MALPAMKATRAMRTMKKKAVSKIAKGRFAKALVLRGTKEKTVGGIKKGDLFKNKRGKIVSKKASAAGKRSFQHIRTWFTACAKARKELQLTGFVAINGKTAAGRALYAKAKAIYAA